MSAGAASNFALLARHAPELARIGHKAEAYFDDPDTCIFNLRKLAEHLVTDALVRLGQRPAPNASFYDLIAELWGTRAVDREIVSKLHAIRMLGNAGVHHTDCSQHDALTQLRGTWVVATWYVQRFFDARARPEPLVVPRPQSPTSAAEVRARAALLERQLAEERRERERSEAEKEALARRLSEPQVAIHAGLNDALAALEPALRPVMTEALERFRAAPRAELARAEPLPEAADPRVVALPLPEEHALIVVRSPRDDLVIPMWLGRREAAARWVDGKRFEVHPTLGTLQVYDLVALERHAPPPAASQTSALLSAHADEDLIALGLPAALVPAVRALDHDAALDALAPYLPAEAAQALYMLAAGYSRAEAEAELARSRPKEEVAADDLAAAVQHPEARRQFKVLSAEESFADALAGSLERWRVFLHPEQRRLVTMRAKGPVRVLGGAGTGKTVALVHRAVHLLREVYPADARPLLVTTFTRNLPFALRTMLATLLEPAELARLEVKNLHRLASEIMRRHGRDHRIATGEETRRAWARASSQATLSLPTSFYVDEWRTVVQAQRIVDLEGYLGADRRGRGTRLARADRRKVWPVLDAYRQSLARDGLTETHDAIVTATALVRTDPPFSSVLADEVQDFSAAELELVRALAPAGDDDLFVVGDPHQRLYGAPVRLSACGIEARGGRARRLDLNYRTTEAIRRFAADFVAPVAADDLDGGRDTLACYRSLRTGDPPTVRHFATPDDELGFVADTLGAWLAEHRPDALCVGARTNELRDRWARALAERGLPIAVLTRDEPETPGIRVATMHRMKGLEFARVCLVSVDAATVPQPYAHAADATAAQHHLDAERCLLYVAATRARDALVVTGTGPPSPLI